MTLRVDTDAGLKHLPCAMDGMSVCHQTHWWEPQPLGWWYLEQTRARLSHEPLPSSFLLWVEENVCTPQSPQFRPWGDPTGARTCGHQKTY